MRMRVFPAPDRLRSHRIHYLGLTPRNEAASRVPSQPHVGLARNHPGSSRSYLVSNYSPFGSSKPCRENTSVTLGLWRALSNASSSRQNQRRRRPFRSNSKSEVRSRAAEFGPFLE